MDILYYDPTESSTESRFTKYGSLEFGHNDNGNIQEQKTVMVELKCLYMRFIFHKPYKNKENFFSQVHIHQLSVFGGQSNMVLPLESPGNRKNMLQMETRALAQDDDEFVSSKLVEIQKRKEQAVLDEDFDEAERLKQIILNVKKFGHRLKALKDKKDEAAEKEDYELARNIKEEVDRLKR